MSLLLGAPDTAVKENDVTTWETNKIGGSPDWFSEGTPIPRCTKCQREMLLVTQIYCPLTHSPYHRCLHIFVCRTKVCSSHSEGWRVIRTQELDKTQSPTDVSSSMGECWTGGQDDWGVGQDDWGDDDMDNGQGLEPASQQPAEPVNPEHSAADRLSQMTIASEEDKSLNLNNSATDTSTNLPQPVSSIPENKTDSDSKDSSANNSDVEGCEMSEDVQVESLALDNEDMQRMMGLLSAQKDLGESCSEDANKVSETNQRGTFPAYYLEVFAESEVEDEMSEHMQGLLQEYQQREGKQFAALLDDHRKGLSGADTEKYDKTEVRHGDKQCYKFIKRLQVYPQQCIRYQWNGSPLLIAKSSSAITGNKCEQCGASRVFEVQLVPPLIAHLKLPGEAESCVEFGTVLVFSCSNSCWSESDVWREECIVLQHDPDQHRFK